MSEHENESVNNETAKDLRAVSQELPKILDTVAEKVPALIRGLVEAAYSETAGRNLGKSVAAFYATLKEQGLPEEMIRQMTQEFLQAQSSLMANAAKGFQMEHGQNHGEEK